MTQGRELSDAAEEDEALEGEWSDEVADALSPAERARPLPRGGPKWKAIEDYWERKRLRDVLQDDYLEEDE